MTGEGRSPARILVVDDAPPTVELLRRNLVALGHTVHTATSVPEALDVLEREPVDLVLTDLKMPQVGGLDLVRHVRANLEDTEVVLMTGYASIEGAVEAMRCGADDYLAKPFTDDELAGAVARALKALHLRRAGRDPGPASAHSGLLGESAPMQRVYRAVARAAATNATVLITGESGTGKELVARAIHYGGPRSSAPFVPVNCGGIPDGLLESELFGHVRGAFTGATASRAGFFQTAEGGTIFLDEVGELPLSMQVKLLRALQDGEVTMVGSSRPRAVDVHIVAATNKDLAEGARTGVFREDLFFRLNVLGIEVPPLRDRGDDVLLLARHFLKKFASEASGAPPSMTQAVLEALRVWPWPGNVRELENVIRRGVVLGEGDTFDLIDLPPTMRFTAPRPGRTLRTLAEVEEEHVLGVLAAVGGNKTRAAAVLGIDRKTLREKLKAFRTRASGRNAPAG